MHKINNCFGVKVISTDEAFYNIKKDWNEVNSNSSKGCIFTSWEWLYTWWEVYQNNGERQLFVLVYSNSDKIITGIAPFQLVNNPKKYFPCGKQLIMLGTGETDGSAVFGEYMDLIITPGFEDEVISSFSSYIYKHKQLWDGLKFHQLLEGSHVSYLFKEQQNEIVQEISAQGYRTLVQLPKTNKEYLMSLKGKVRNNITRMLSRLEREQFYSIESIVKEEDVDSAILILAGLNRSRRGDLKKPSAFDQPNFVHFHQIIAKRLIVKKAITLRIMRFANEPVAATYQFVDKNMVHGYQSGFDAKQGNRYSLMTMLVTHEIANSIENKDIDYFNFMYSENESSYKKKYTGITETMYVISYSHNNLKGKTYRCIHGFIKEQVKKVVKLGNIPK